MMAIHGALPGSRTAKLWDSIKATVLLRILDYKTHTERVRESSRPVSTESDVRWT